MSAGGSDMKLLDLYAQLSVKGWDQYRTQLGNAAKGADALTRQLSTAIKRLESLPSTIGSQIRKHITDPLKNMVIGAGVVMGLKGLWDMASESERAGIRFKAVFEDMDAAVAEWAASLGENMSMPVGAVKNMLMQTQLALESAGWNPSKALGVGKMIAPRAIDLAAMTGAEPGEISRAMTAAMSGNMRMLGQYGTRIPEVAVDHKLLEWGWLRGAKAATEEQMALARLAVVMDRTRKSEGMMERMGGTMWATWDRLSDAVRKLSANIAKVLTPAMQVLFDVVGRLGEVFSRAMANANQWGKAIAGMLKPWIEGVGAIVGGLVESPVKTFQMFGNAIWSVFQWLALKIYEVVNMIAEAFIGVGRTIWDVFNRTFRMIIGMLQQFGSWLAEYFSAIASYMGDMISYSAKLIRSKIPGLGGETPEKPEWEDYSGRVQGLGDRMAGELNKAFGDFNPGKFFEKVGRQFETFLGGKFNAADWWGVTNEAFKQLEGTLGRIKFTFGELLAAFIAPKKTKPLEASKLDLKKMFWGGGGDRFGKGDVVSLAFEAVQGHFQSMENKRANEMLKVAKDQLDTQKESKQLLEKIGKNTEDMGVWRP